MLFLDCDDERLERRYTETRRRHPLAGDRPVTDGIRLERQSFPPLRDRADLVIDTSALTAGRSEAPAARPFRARPSPACASSSPPSPIATACRATPIWSSTCAFFTIRIMSTSLRPLTGRDAAVGAYIAEPIRISDRSSSGCGTGSHPLLPRYERGARPISPSPSAAPAAAIARSMCAERLALRLRGAGWRVELAHRDLAVGHRRTGPDRHARRRRLSGDGRPQ